MPYVIRSDQGNISGVFAEHVVGSEFVNEDDAGLRIFLSSIANSDSTNIVASDLDFVRVLEDLVELLISKGVILFTELPESAREKMLARQRLRSEISGRLDLLGDD